MQHRDVQIISKWAKYVIKHKRKLLNKDDWRIIGSDLKTTDKLRPFITRKIIMSNIDVANQTLINILTRNGITEDKPFEIYEKARKIAEVKENSRDLITIADRYTELLDLKPKHTETHTQTEKVSYIGMLESGQKGKLTATKTIKQANNTQLDNDNTSNESETIKDQGTSEG